MSIISALIQPVTKILDKVIPDADTKQRIAHEIATQAHTIAQAQIEVNKTEAQSKTYLSQVGDPLWVGLVALEWRVTSLLFRWQTLRLLYPVLQSLFPL